MGRIVAGGHFHHCVFPDLPKIVGTDGSRSSRTAETSSSATMMGRSHCAEPAERNARERARSGRNMMMMMMFGAGESVGVPGV